jgi:hypothetical protein
LEEWIEKKFKQIKKSFVFEFVNAKKNEEIENAIINVIVLLFIFIQFKAFKDNFFLFIKLKIFKVLFNEW